MYLVDLSDDKFGNAWDNFIDRNPFEVQSSLAKILKTINAVDNADSSSEIWFLTEEDAIIFLLKYST
jgi:hypothetical protein